MEFLNRRTIRKYKEEDIKTEELKKILEVALVAPSGMNKKPFEFVIVKDKKTLKELSVAKTSGGLMIADAPLAIVILGKPFESTTWIEDCSIASTLIQLKAWELGIGACWVQLRGRENASGNPSEDVVKSLLEIPGEYSVLCVISLGYPNEEKPSYSEKDMNFTKIHYEKF